ncbi:hypothetical protein D3C86_1540250 [compost metagenome]
MNIERLRNPSDDVTRHTGIDLPGKFDEPRWQFIFPRFPGEIERVDRYAVAAKTRTGIKGHETKRLGFRRIDHFPYVDTHRLVDDLEFIDEGDIDGTEDVFGDFHRFRRGIGRNRNDFFDHRTVKSLHQLSSGLTIASDNLRNG